LVNACLTSSDWYLSNIHNIDDDLKHKCAQDIINDLLFISLNFMCTYFIEQAKQEIN